MVQGCAQESGGHNVYHDVMGDPRQAGEMRPGLSWTGDGFCGRQGSACYGCPPGGHAQSVECSCVPSLCLFTPQLSWPEPHAQCMAFSWPLSQGLALCGLARGMPSLGVGRLPQGGTGLGWGWSPYQGCIHLALGCGSPGPLQSWTACLSSR